jgi:acyl-coenzyme A synthetase/AMP-(fatty) acid ligase
VQVSAARRRAGWSEHDDWLHTEYPREVRVVDAIPLTSVLKTDRKRLRALLTAE